MKQTPFQYLIDGFEKDENSFMMDSHKKTFQKFYGKENLRYKSPVGYIDIVQNQSYISHVYFNDNSVFFAPLSTPVTDLLKQTKDILDRYYDGEPVDFKVIPIDIEHGTVFQNQVWNAIFQIPYGEVRSYKWIAEQVGRPKAVRAVGNATGSNPISIINPCHRVVGTNGNLGGYGGGLDRKRQLLTLEGYPVEVMSEK